MNQAVASQETLAPEIIVKRFLRALEIQDHERIAELLAPELLYSNVSLPTLRGGKRVSDLFKLALRPGTEFGVTIHNLAVNGDTVLTERTDLLRVGPFQSTFWVCGTFQVKDGKIVVWRDYFDWKDVTQGSLRGLAGIFLPRLRPTL